MPSIKAKILRKILKKIMNFDKPLEAIRSDFDKMTTKVKMRKDTMMSHVDADGVPCFLVEPVVNRNKEDVKTIFYLHGGGYCLGLYPTGQSFAALLAEKYGMNVLIVDYRVAPENPFPASIDDTMTAYKWLEAKVGSSDNIVFYAESAGCGLALNTLVKLRDEKRSMPAATAFATPFLDATMSSASIQRFKDVDPYYASEEHQIVDHYTKGLDKKNPLVSPLFHEVHDLTPIMVHIAECDMLCDDGYKLVEKIKKAGGAVSYKVFEGMWHVFHMHGDTLKESKAALNDILVFYQLHLT